MPPSVVEAAVDALKASMSVKMKIEDDPMAKLQNDIFNLQKQLDELELAEVRSHF